jgi:glyoxylase-like metal-dependent hydrolase (beta-lactamase superfamily II)
LSLGRRPAVHALWAAGVLGVLSGLGLAFAPYLFAEVSPSLEPHAIIDPAKPDLGEGRMVDDYWAGMIDGLVPPTFSVTEWVKPGTTIDLGGRVLRVLHVPGHTHSSVALYDAATHRRRG